MNRHRRRAAAKLGVRGNPDITAIPPDVSALFGVAVMHHKTGELAKAEAFYRHVLQAEPNHADAVHLLGVIALQVGRYDVAVDLIRQAISLNGNNPDYFSDMGNACFAQGNFEAAVAACREVIRLAPGGAIGHCNLGTALFHLGKLDDAVARIAKRCGSSPIMPRPMATSAQHSMSKASTMPRSLPIGGLSA